MYIQTPHDHTEPTLMVKLSNDKGQEQQIEEGMKEDWIDEFSVQENEDSFSSSSQDSDSSSSSDSFDPESSKSGSSDYHASDQKKSSLSSTILPYIYNSSAYNNMIRNRRQSENSKQHTAPLGQTDSSETRKSQFKRKDLKDSISYHSIPALYLNAFRIMISRKSSAFLLLSVVIWFSMQYYVLSHLESEPETPQQAEIRRIQERLNQIKHQRRNEEGAISALGSAVTSLFHKNKRYVKPSMDGLIAVSDPIPKDCSPLEWHEMNYPNCNDMHDSDLKEVFHYQRRGPVIPMDLGEGDKSEIVYTKDELEISASMGYLGSGMWRQVWKLNPRLAREDAVLKMMKSEHTVDHRNFDRHRRDAIVMERLQNSPHVVSIYGFCGNTVLTEYSGVSLSDFIFTDENYTSPYQKEDMIGKIDMAIDLLEGIKSLHDLHIVHADIQVKQFLLDSRYGLKVNDFNRCRFLPKHNISGESCPLKIPSAPGGNRSPEEYELSKSDEKIDIFSAGNILFGILTGERPWVGVPSDSVRRNVMKGILPPFPIDFESGSISEAFAALIYQAYEFHPKNRPSAMDLLKEFKALRERAL